MSLRNTHEQILSKSFPRVSGDEPLKALGMQGEQMFSPRERG